MQPHIIALLAEFTAALGFIAGWYIGRHGFAVTVASLVADVQSLKTKVSLTPIVTYTSIPNKVVPTMSTTGVAVQH